MLLDFTKFNLNDWDIDLPIFWRMTLECSQVTIRLLQPIAKERDSLDIDEFCCVYVDKSRTVIGGERTCLRRQASMT